MDNGHMLTGCVLGSWGFQNYQQPSVSRRFLEDLKRVNKEWFIWYDFAEFAIFCGWSSGK